MDRFIQYGLEQAWAQDTLQGQLNVYLGVSRFMNAVIGTGGINGLVAAPTAVPSLSVDVGAGEIYEMAETDVTEYGTAPFSLPADATEILKQGNYIGGNFATPAPGTPGDSIIYLIEAAFDETDGEPVSRPFFGGPPSVVNTQRQDTALVQIIAGTPAPSPVAPTPTAGYTGLWLITVANGQASVLAGDIAAYPGTIFFTSKLQDKLSLAEADARYTKLPPVGNSGYFWTASIATTAINTTPAVLPLTPGTNPLTWIASNRFTPTFPCYVVVSGPIIFTSTVNPSELIVNLSLNGSTLVGAATGGFLGAGTEEYSISAVVSMNGTTDYLEFNGRTATGGTTQDVSCDHIGFVVIAN